MASAEGGRGVASAPQVQEQRGGPARGRRRAGRGTWTGAQSRTRWGGDPPPGGGSVRVVVLGPTRDLQEVAEPALRCRAPPEGRRKPRGTPGGVGGPRGPREGPQVSDPGGVARQGADVAGLPGGGSGAPHHGCGRQQLAPRALRSALATGATAGTTRRRRSPSPHTSGGASERPRRRAREGWRGGWAP